MDASTPAPAAARAISIGFRAQSRAEEFANSLSHGLGAAVGIAGLVLMVVAASLQGDPYGIVGAAVHGSSVVLLFTASMLYHAFRQPRLKRVFQILDHVAIHLLIAGTYTPFALVTLRGPWGWTLLGLVWGFAIAGIVFESLWIDRFPRLSTASYLATGWVGVLVVWPVFQALPLGAIALLAIGGLSYTGGVVFFARNRPYDHLIWHVFVLVGAASHMLAVLTYVVG